MPVIAEEELPDGIVVIGETMKAGTDENSAIPEQAIP
jgi:hypothetical protein